MEKAIAKKIGTAVGLLLCVVFAFLLICNVTIIVKGTIDPEKPPSVFGVTPMVVLSGSMSGSAQDHIEVGDLIFTTAPDPAALKEGDVVSFMENTTVITHRIVQITTDETGQTVYITKGDANNTEDPPIYASDIIGIFRFRIPFLGDLAIFLQQPIGMALFIGIPVCAFVVYDVFRRNRTRSKEAEENERLKAELEALRSAAQNDNKDQA